MLGVQGSGGQATGQEAGRPQDGPEPAAGPGTGTAAERQRRALLLGLGAAAVVVIAAAAIYGLTRAGAQQAAGRGHRARAASGAAAVAPLRVISVTPATGARLADGSAPVVVQFSAPLAARSVMPVLSPPAAGHWSRLGDDAAFTPARPLSPARRFAVRIPAGSGGVTTAAGATLARPEVARFTTRGYSSLRLDQLLSQLGYLPVTWSPEQSPAARAELLAQGNQPASQAGMAYDPPSGAFRWQAGYPAVLTGLWQPGQPGLLLRGAIMAFESQHGMITDGVASPRLWAAVFGAAGKDQRNASGYTYALASKAVPESLTIWHDGRVVLRSLANTGIPVAPTSDGTFPVYLRYPFQVMRGLNPDGTSYADPVSFVSYFNGGEAVHYYPRGSYGFQQSLGCVELPYTAARDAYPYLTYGSLVTVAG